MSERYPDHTILKDVGSGLNFKRKQLLFLLEECAMGRVGEIVIAYRDRLCRFGFELLEWFFSKNSVKLVVLEQQELSPQQELVSDLLSVITDFSSRVHGLRKYRDKVKEDSSLSKQGTEDDT
jgi:predicted site-specific integrase-resolvase